MEDVDHDREYPTAEGEQNPLIVAEDTTDAVSDERSAIPGVGRPWPVRTDFRGILLEVLCARCVQGIHQFINYWATYTFFPVLHFIKWD